MNNVKVCKITISASLILFIMSDKFISSCIYKMFVIAFTYTSVERNKYIDTYINCEIYKAHFCVIYLKKY